MNVLKRPGIRLRVSGSRFNGYWSKRVWREQAPLFLFSHVTQFLGRCEQITAHQQQTKDAIKIHLGFWWINGFFLSALLTRVKVRGFVSCGNRCDSKAAAARPQPTLAWKAGSGVHCTAAASSQAASRHLSWSFPSSAALTALLSMGRKRPERLLSSCKRRQKETGTRAWGAVRSRTSLCWWWKVL